jgi:hypothetical protein
MGKALRAALPDSAVEFGRRRTERVVPRHVVEKPQDLRARRVFVASNDFIEVSLDAVVGAIPPRELLNAGEQILGILVAELAVVGSLRTLIAAAFTESETRKAMLSGMHSRPNRPPRSPAQGRSVPRHGLRLPPHQAATRFQRTLGREGQQQVSWRMRRSRHVPLPSDTTRFAPFAVDAHSAIRLLTRPTDKQHVSLRLPPCLYLLPISNNPPWTEHDPHPPMRGAGSITTVLAEAQRMSAEGSSRSE